MKYGEKELKELQETLSEMLTYVDEICKKKNLIYFLYGGTALGAKRHHGFIPWDDDLDIVMPRNDYDVLIDYLMNQNKKGEYFIQNERTESSYYLFYSKLRKNGTVFKEEYSNEAYHHYGVFLDIFPMDEVKSKTSFEIKLRVRCIKLINACLCFHACKNNYKKKMPPIVFFLLGVITEIMFIIPTKKWVVLENHLLKKDQHKKCSYVMTLTNGSKLKSKEIKDKSIYFPPQSVMFENNLRNGPAMLDDYCRITYGENYMEIPPVEKRVNHRPVELKL